MNIEQLKFILAAYGVPSKIPLDKIPNELEYSHFQVSGNDLVFTKKSRDYFYIDYIDVETGQISFEDIMIMNSYPPAPDSLLRLIHIDKPCCPLIIAD